MGDPLSASLNQSTPSGPGTASSAISIADCNCGRRVIEPRVPFSGSAQCVLGPNLQGITGHRRFAPAGRSAFVEYFELQHVIFDGKTGALYKSGKHVTETRYATHPSSRFQVRPERVIQLREDRPISIGFNSWHGNYYHWLIQCIPSIYWARKIHTDGRFVVALPELNSWQEMLLRLAGLSEIERYTVDLGWQYEVRRLTYTTFTQGATAAWPSAKAAEVFQSMASRVERSSTDAQRTIYVSREDTLKRRMLNEAELCERLKAEGVEIIVPSRHSIAEQIDLFRSAKIIIGPHGAGLANIVFCERGTTLYEIMRDRGLNSSMANLAHSAGLNYWAEAFPSRSDNGDSDEWSVDSQQVIQTLERLRNIN